MAFVGQRGPALGEGELVVRGLPVVGEGLGVDHLHLSRIAAVLMRAEQMEGVEQHGDLHLPGVFDTRHRCQRIGIGQEHVKLGRGVPLQAVITAVGMVEMERAQANLAEARRKLEEAKSDRVMGELDRLLGNEPRKP